MLRFHPAALLAVPLSGRSRYVLTIHCVRHDATVRALHRIAAASLPTSPPGSPEAVTKQETPGTGIPEVSTAPNLAATDQEGRCAQSATDR